jgi:flagellar protein FlgJ
MIDPVLIQPVSLIAPKKSIEPKKSAKVEDAAKQFEALMIAQMLRSVRESGAGGLGSESDNASSTMLDLADQQFSKLLANNGGLGLAKLVVKGLKQTAKE